MQRVLLGGGGLDGAHWCLGCAASAAAVKGMLYAIFRFLLFYIKVKILFRFLFISKNRG